MKVLRRLSLPALALGWMVTSGAAPAADAVRVVATLPDLGNLVGQVGGDEVDVMVLTRGPQDAHFVEPRPSFVRRLHDADLFVQGGMDLEIGWAPALLRSARNARIQPGAPGHLDASRAIDPLERPTGPLDRSMGDVHPYGNPHYLTDPLNGLRVARLIRDRLTELRPGGAQTFRERYRDFARRLLTALAGPALAGPTDLDELARRVERGDLPTEQLGGWLGAMAPHRGTPAVQDHKLWPYFARRFGLVLVATLEPRPGIAPTTRHLSDVVERIRRDSVPIILASPYFDPRHARWVSERTGARVVEMAHQTGARSGTADYLATIDHNVRRILEAL